MRDVHQVDGEEEEAVAFPVFRDRKTFSKCGQKLFSPERNVLIRERRRERERNVYIVNRYRFGGQVARSI